MTSSITIQILIVLALSGCQTDKAEHKTLGNSAHAIQSAVSIAAETTAEFCDSTKIKDFKNNLTILSEELTDVETDYQFKQAIEFIAESCQRDTLFCGEINLKRSAAYSYDNEWKLLLTGYVLDQEPGMEIDAASFFVVTILKNNEFWFTDILEDLIGEIKVELNGFTAENAQVTVWGHAYPYFQADYGKFRLTINNGEPYYEFQCHSQHTKALN